MKRIKLVVLAATAFVGFAFTTNTTASAQTIREWVPRTVEEIKADLAKNTKDGVSSYTVKWGDTLYALALATDIPMEQLAALNNIENIRLIEENSVFYFNEDKTVVSISDGINVESYDTTNGEKVEVSPEEKEHIQQAAQTQQNTTSATDESAQNQATQEVQTTTQAATQTTSSSPKLYTLSQFMYNGVVNWNGLKFTYYSQSVLPGGGLSIPGRHVNADGYVSDGDGYIVLASSAPLGTVIDTPFGYQGKVYDRGTTGNHYDVYIR